MNVNSIIQYKLDQKFYTKSQLNFRIIYANLVITQTYFTNNNMYIFI